jgi:methionyl-tRNA synthetase
VEIVKEQSYFLKLSKYQLPILKHIEENTGFIAPEARRNEIVQFIKQGLRDLSITRTTFRWGVPVPGDTNHVIYVWFDALINYLSALGYPDGEKFQKYWPADVHLMGKEIVRFHAVTWPCMLLALGLPLPKTIFGHGWWTVEGKKMSKSKGNVVDPIALSEKYGVDAVRYFLLREVPFGTDGDFSLKSFILRHNADLANDLGNLLNRTLTMVEKYFHSAIPSPNDKSKSQDSMSDDLNKTIQNLPLTVGSKMEKLAFSEALGEIWALVNKANVYIEQQAPWAIAKAKDEEKLRMVMFNLAEVLRVVAVTIAPFMPQTAAKMWAQLGLSEPISLKASLAGVKVAKGEPLFPRQELS